MRNTCWKIFLAWVAMVGLSGGAKADPVEYVRMCDAYGPNYFYSPGTEICINAQTGETAYETVDGTVRGLTSLAARLYQDHVRLVELEQQIAIATALEDPDLVGSERFAIKMNWGNAGSENAFGMTGALVLFDQSPQQGGGRVTLSGGLAFSGSQANGRASLQFSW